MEHRVIILEVGIRAGEAKKEKAERSERGSSWERGGGGWMERRKDRDGPGGSLQFQLTSGRATPVFLFLGIEQDLDSKPASITLLAV